MAGMLDGKVAVVTGAGRGIGRATAICLAANGAKVVVCDVGAAVTGEGHDVGPAEQVVAEITQANGAGRAVANTDSVAEWENAQKIVQTAIDNWGAIDGVVCIAGILRERMLFNMSEEEWDAVVDVHLKGAFSPTRHAAAYWRDRAKAGTPIKARVVNTSSPSGIFGNAGQTNYGAAKAGIAAFTIICGLELGRCSAGLATLGDEALQTRVLLGQPALDHLPELVALQLLQPKYPAA